MTKARAALLWERAWPKVVPVLCATGLMASAAWLGAFRPMSPEARVGTVAVFGAAAAVAAARVRSGSLLVTRGDALRRMDGFTGNPHNPAQTIDDRPGAGTPPVSVALWESHVANLRKEWTDKFEAGTPRPGMKQRDPWNLRYGVMALTVAAGIYAGEERLARLREAFDFSARAPVAIAKIEDLIPVKAWVTAPAGIDKQPLYLTEKTKDHTQGGEELVVHKNSALTLMTFGPQTRVTVNGAAIEPAKSITTREDGKDQSTFQYDIAMTGEALSVTVEKGPRWQFKITPDNAPTVKLESVTAAKDNPKVLDVEYATHDDYGIKDGAVIATPAGTDKNARPLPSSKLPPVMIR